MHTHTHTHTHRPAQVHTCTPTKGQTTDFLCSLSFLVFLFNVSSTIRVWDYTAESCILTLQGHNGPVRGLLWSPEIPYMLFSGSWDYSIRIWDIRDGACLDTILDHGADVYGNYGYVYLYSSL